MYQSQNSKLLLRQLNEQYLSTTYLTDSKKNNPIFNKNCRDLAVATCNYQTTIENLPEQFSRW